MPRRNYYRQRLLPQRSRNNIISHFVRTRETDVKGIIAKTTQLFGQRHFRYTKDGCWLFLPTQCQQQRQPVLSNAIRDSNRSEEHTSELQSLMRISYAVFCLKKKNTTIHNT